MIEIDGSLGEGGGQIVRTSLALSLVTGKPFRIINIRGGRKKPGLMRQHLTALNAAVAVGSAEVAGNAIGSQSVTFKPGKVRSGKFHFAVGTAGSSTLVLQTVLPALLQVAGPSELILEGGTHNPFAPPYDFLARTFLPLVDRMGPAVTPGLERPGFYPAGGGKFRVVIQPSAALSPLELLDRGPVRRQMARAVVANLPITIAKRELKVIGDRFGWDEKELVAEAVDNAAGPGNVVIIAIESDALTEVFTGFGARGVSAEKVAQGAVQQALEYLHGNVPVGRYLADQLLVPLAMAGQGRYRTPRPTLHTKTNIAIIRRFLDVEIRLTERGPDQWQIEIR